MLATCYIGNNRLQLPWLPSRRIRGTTRRMRDVCLLLDEQLAERLYKAAVPTAPAELLNLSLPLSLCLFLSLAVSLCSGYACVCVTRGQSHRGNCWIVWVDVLLLMLRLLQLVLLLPFESQCASIALVEAISFHS